MKKTQMFSALIFGLVFCILGYIYATHTAANLPGYFPGYQAGYNHIHTKHSIAAFALAAGCFIFAWFQSGSKETI